MENKKEMGEKISQNMKQTAETMSETILAVLDKLAGKQSDLKLSFQDLTLDTPMAKLKLNGAIVLDIVYSREAAETTKAM